MEWIPQHDQAAVVKLLQLALLPLLAACAIRPVTIDIGTAVAPPPAAVYWALGAPRPHDHVTDATGRDCNDYAHAAFLHLTAIGRHPRYLVVRIPDGQAHMIVESDGVAYDNLERGPVRVRDLPYTWLGASPDGVHWFRIKRWDVKS
jgi:hypothetical protein